MSTPRSDVAKPFDISKWVVWEAYRQVKANRGAAGVDEESIAEFEGDLKGNKRDFVRRVLAGVCVDLKESLHSDLHVRPWGESMTTRGGIS